MFNMLSAHPESVQDVARKLGLCARVKQTYKLENPTEKSIQKEILRNGMVVTDWLVPSYLRTYKTGLF